MAQAPGAKPQVNLGAPPPSCRPQPPANSLGSPLAALCRALVSEGTGHAGTTDGGFAGLAVPPAQCAAAPPRGHRPQLRCTLEPGAASSHGDP